MKHFARRRLVAWVITLLVVAVILVINQISAGRIGSYGFTSGWTLLALILFLAAYNLRKSLPFLPLGSSTSWMQLHIYAGFVTLAVFIVHVGFKIPNGVFEGLLAATYLLVFLSGVIGLVMTRSFPARLTMLGEEVIFEQIPVLRRELQVKIEALVLVENSAGQSSVTAEFYRDKIRPYLLHHCDLLSHLTRGGSARWHRLSGTIDDQKRYMNDDEQQLLEEVRQYTKQKHELDTRFALQGALKLWLFVHVPATWSLLIFAVTHMILIYAWSGVAL